jgi:hypothetical protein
MRITFMRNIFKNTFKKATLVSIAVTVALASTSAAAKISEQEAAKLEKELTPFGAVRAANADGSIPAWTGGIKSAPAGYKVGDHHLDPFADDKAMYTITAKNLAQYKNLLTPGQIKLFETYPDTYKMSVYQSRRSASYPEHVYQANLENATRTELVEGGNGIIQGQAKDGITAEARVHPEVSLGMCIAIIAPDWCQKIKPSRNSL